MNERKIKMTSDLTVTADAWRLAIERTASPNQLRQEIKRMEKEEPELLKHAMVEAHGILEGLRMNWAPGPVSSMVDLGITLLIARVFIAMKIGHFRLWEADLGVGIDATTPTSSATSPKPGGKRGRGAAGRGI
jgi:hypothetical protein